MRSLSQFRPFIDFRDDFNSRVLIDFLNFFFSFFLDLLFEIVDFFFILIFIADRLLLPTWLSRVALLTIRATSLFMG